MSTKILFILEGEKKEKSITENLTKFFVNERTVIICAYCTTIYKMYQEIVNDQDLDTFSLLKEMKQNKDLKNFKRSDFAEIYMFFDYDGHASNANDTKLYDLLNFFDEETEKGKLYISYPMVEALKHIENFDTFSNLKVNYKANDYKKIVNSKCIRELIDLNLYNFDTWKKLIDIHLRKMNFIVHNSFEFPSTLIRQLTIFEKQVEKYKNIDQNVAVLSAFPIFLYDYYGHYEMKKRLLFQQL